MAAKQLRLAVVVAATEAGGIGLKGSIPWRIPGDMTHFRKVTQECPKGLLNAVIMGRKTWCSIPPAFRPLKDRINVVLSTDPDTCRSKEDIPETVHVASSMDKALEVLSGCSNVHRVFAIGGAQVYNEALALPNCDTVYWTTVLKKFECDVTVPAVNETAFEVASKSEVKTHGEGEDCIKYQFITYTRCAVPSGPVCGTGTSVTPVKPKRADASTGVASTPERAIPVVGGGGGGSGGEDAAKVAESAPPSVGVSSGADAAAAAVAALDAGADSKAERSSRPSPIAPLSGRHEEMQYIDIVRDILKSGVHRGDRTGTGTISKFGIQMRFSLRDNVLPLLTTKRVFWRGVAEELVWFVSGKTHADLLKEKKIHIWDGNGSREFLDGLGLHDREEGDLGPVYGFQWRHFGAEYRTAHDDYTGKGVDQLAQVIETIKKNPQSRRIIMSAWNPADLKEMALPPCHMFCQFYVNDGKLSCQMYQRSADMGLGVPFNIASYALLTRMIAQVTDLEADEFVHVIGDAHVYANHVEALQEQLKREPFEFPKLHIDPSIKNIDDFRYEHFKVEGYKCHKTIKMKMAV